MVKRFLLLWVIGLFTLIPYGIYYLFFEATRDEYVLVFVLMLFWIFAYWVVVGPIVSALKIHKMIRALENTKSGEDLKALIQSNESKETMVELIASENHVSKFIASFVFNLFVKRLSEKDKSPESRGIQ